MRLLITAIGSMAAECAIKRMKANGCFVVGCDVYPKEWHMESKLCDAFFQSPFASSEDEYIDFLCKVCLEKQLDGIIPLTDLEIDVINRNRVLFEEKNILLCMQSPQVLEVVRNKYALYLFFKDDDIVPMIETHLATNIPKNFKYPCIAKPCNGRSSEGLMRNVSRCQVAAISEKNNYIVQKELSGIIYTVDYVRSSNFGTDASVARQELLRTKNGAGLTIKTCNDSKLIALVSYIGEKLNINGCVNMEFIKSQNEYYLIDINPRYSAGIAFSLMAGYDMVTNHLNCFMGKNIDAPINVEEIIMIKKYEECISN